MKKKIIIDTDPGVDDAMALGFVAGSPALELIAVTTTKGNGPLDITTKNALFLVDMLGMNVPVARGVAHSISPYEKHPTPTWIHGEGALGEFVLPEISNKESELSAPDMIIKLVNDYPGEVTIVTIGRLTNLALALEKAPDIIGKVAEVVVMGGAFGFNGHQGNVTPFAEANILGDPYAAHAVLTANWLVTMVGLDVTQEAIFPFGALEQLWNTCGGYGEIFRQIASTYENFHKQKNLKGIYIHDSSAIAYLLKPEIFQVVSRITGVQLDGQEVGRTYVKLDQEVTGGSRANNICVSVQTDLLITMMRQSFESLGR